MPFFFPRRTAIVQESAAYGILRIAQYDSHFAAENAKLAASTAQRSEGRRIGSCRNPAIRSGFASSGAAMGTHPAVRAGIRPLVYAFCFPRRTLIASKSTGLLK